MNGGGKYEVVLFSKKWRNPVSYYYFPLTAEGLRKAKEKRSELMARYLDNDVELRKCDTTAG